MNAASASPVARWVWLIILVVGAMALATHATTIAVLQGDLNIDDAYISFQYARNLVEGHGLVYNPGERVEGYTSPLWVVVLAGLYACGLNLEVAARVVALLCGMALVLVVGRTASGRAATPLWAALAAVAVVAGDPSVARWAQDGMETVPFTLFVAVVVARRLYELDQNCDPWVSTVLAGVLTWMRPEGVLVFGAGWLAGWCLPNHGGMRARLTAQALMGVAFVGVVGPHVLWRLWYYGYPLPNTFYAKVGATEAQVQRGWSYVANFWVVHRPALVVTSVAALAATARRWSAGSTYLGVLVVGWTLYVALVGGDWMGPGRFLVPVVPALAVLVARQLATWGGTDDTIPSTAPRRAVVALAAVALAGAASVFTAGPVERQSVVDDRPISESRRALGQFLAARAPQDARILTNEIGTIGWFSRRYVLDLYGLIDPEIAHLEVETMGTGKPGHEKSDLDYSLTQGPTIIAMAGLSQHYLRGGVDPRLGAFSLQDTGIDVPIRAFRFVLVRRPPAPTATSD